MRRFAVALVGTLALSALAALAAAEQDTAQRPRVYALVSAMGNRFTVVYEQQSTGSHLPPYHRETYEIAENVLNRIVLNGLDKAIAKADPESRRLYLSTAPSRARGRFASEELVIDPVIEQLRKLDRASWDRIVIAAPAYRYQSKDGLATRMQGMGIFSEPLCQSDSGTGRRIGSCDQGFHPPSGPEALTPEGKVIAANTYIAPYSFVEIWVLDAHTLAVLDHAASFNHRKLTDASASIHGVMSGDSRDFLNAQLLDVIQASVADAVEGTQLRGNVEVKEKGPVK